MAVIRPFCCIHPAKGLEAEIAALPYDVYHREDAREVVQGKPLSFLNIDRPDPVNLTKRLEIHDLTVKNIYGLKALDHVSFDVYGGVARKA